MKLIHTETRVHAYCQRLAAKQARALAMQPTRGLFQWRRCYRLMRCAKAAIQMGLFQEAIDFRQEAFRIHVRLARLAEAMTTDYSIQ